MLQVYAKYIAQNQTIVVIRETDTTVNVSFDAQLAGNHLDKSDDELLSLAMSWFTNRYVQEYALQKVLTDVETIKGNSDKATKQAQEAIASVSIITDTLDNVKSASDQLATTFEEVLPRFEQVWEHFVTVEKTDAMKADEEVEEPTPTPKEELHVETEEEKQAREAQKAAASEDDEIIIEE